MSVPARCEDGMDRHDWYAGMMAYARGADNDDLLARMYASLYTGSGALPPGWGLPAPVFAALLEHHFPGYPYPLAVAVEPSAGRSRQAEVADLEYLLVEHRAGRSISELWMAAIVAGACLGNDHLWQDLGLWNRADLGRLMHGNFPSLAARNVHDMKWKKFLYKQLCEADGVRVCRAPSCEVCTDYQDCFGPEV